ncbi:glycosyl transferase family 2 [Paraburkholderia sp. BL8N3]|nr:glycosyl transferase family 2 [Paraburkholderia sp. BL8N3]
MHTASDRTRARLLTVVISAHNVESFIEESLNSVLSQRWVDAIDIAVVDVGSTDSTYDAAKAVAERHRDKHIRLIRQSVCSRGGGRKTDLALVKTPYVTFLDGSDICMPNFSDMIVPLLAGEKWDMLEYNVAILGNDGKVRRGIELVREENVGGYAMNPATLMSLADQYHTYAWARTYKTALFRPDPFPAARSFEEEAVGSSVYVRAQSVYRLHARLAGYRRRPGTFEQRSSMHDVRDLAITGDEVLARCQGGEHDEYWLTIFRKLFRRACRVSVCVDRASFGEALSFLDHMSTN